MPKTWQAAAFCAVLCAAFGAAPALAQHEHSAAEHSEGDHSASEFEVFVAAEALGGSGQPHPRDDDSWFDADVVFGLTRDHFRVFGEYYITPYEHEFERLQVGYELVPDTVLWLGRFHQPGSAWNTEHHHGRYLQTAVTRPSIENWEDESGLIPQHITGALLESRRPLGSSAGLQVSSGVGISPAITRDGFEPITIGNNPDRHGASITGRLAFLPDYSGPSSVGLLWGHDQVYFSNPAAAASLHSYHALLGIYGAYADWNVAAWRFIGAAYYVDIQLDAAARDESFIAGYVQAERELPHQLTAFGRIEDSARMRESRYVALFNDPSGDLDITLRRLAAGLRWDYARRQALSGEVAHVVGLYKSGYEIRLLWSAAIP
jgi:hypothetical protein